MQRKPKVAVDLDGVLFDFASPFLQWHDRRYGTNLRMQELGPGTRLWELWKGTEEEAVKRVLTFYRQIDLLRFEPIVGAQEALVRLKSRYDFVIVSGRDAALETLTTAWLATYFPGTFREVMLGVSGPRGPWGSFSKAQVCSRIEATAIIDDNPLYAEDCAQAGMRALLFGEYPWNRAVILPQNILRVVDWHKASCVLLDTDL